MEFRFDIFTYPIWKEIMVFRIHHSGMFIRTVAQAAGRDDKDRSDRDSLNLNDFLSLKLVH
ncbi:hypothetical protein CCS41_10670 [Candidatus Fukatsuia symbiotica]|uniref:Uncharacterized protein n=1 Tax=Candidatus Fukatsuia symbiotica TaxID=1878942 RepID=A0A2U8I6R0_9GAMM|nr:hypothetical protein CCS41_10670 [Candidatus Fukatsuia symbiotica]